VRRGPGRVTDPVCVCVSPENKNVERDDMAFRHSLDNYPYTVEFGMLVYFLYYIGQVQRSRSKFTVVITWPHVGDGCVCLLVGRITLKVVVALFLMKFDE